MPKSVADRIAQVAERISSLLGPPELHAALRAVGTPGRSALRATLLSA
jgi:hypothetical protein